MLERKIAARLLAAAGLVSLSACTTVGTDFTPVAAASDARPLVYLYFQCNAATNEYFAGGTHGPKLKLDGDFVGYLAPDSYVPLDVPAGGVDMAFLSTWNNNFPKLKFAFVPEAPVTYLRFDLSARDINVLSYELIAEVSAIEPAVAQDEIRDCQLNAALHERTRANGFSR